MVKVCGLIAEEQEQQIKRTLQAPCLENFKKGAVPDCHHIV